MPQTYSEQNLWRNIINIPMKGRNKIKVLANTIIEYYNVSARKRKKEIRLINREILDHIC